MLCRNFLRQAHQASNILARTRAAPTLQQPYDISSKFPVLTRARILSRWYTEAAQPKEVDESLGQGSPKYDEPTVAKDNDSAATSKQESPLTKELDAKSKEVVELKDKYLRQVAEYRNLQERTRREVQASKDFAIQRFAKDLIESIDTFDLALASIPADKVVPPSSETAPDVDKDLRMLHSGLKMTETVLMNTLKKHGLERYDPSENGEKFNPNVHEATFFAPQPDKEDGIVFHTTQKGFMLNGRVLRAAKVGIVRNS